MAKTQRLKNQNGARDAKKKKKKKKKTRRRKKKKKKKKKNDEEDIYRAFEALLCLSLFS